MIVDLRHVTLRDRVTDRIFHATGDKECRLLFLRWEQRFVGAVRVMFLGVHLFCFNNIFFYRSMEHARVSFNRFLVVLSSSAVS